MIGGEHPTSGLAGVTVGGVRMKRFPCCRLKHAVRFPLVTQIQATASHDHSSCSVTYSLQTGGQRSEVSPEDRTSLWLVVFGEAACVSMNSSYSCSLEPSVSSRQQRPAAEGERRTPQNTKQSSSSSEQRCYGRPAVGGLGHKTDSQFKNNLNKRNETSV